MSDIGIAIKDRKEICKRLETLLAQTYALYLKTQNFHWNVVGPQFQELHLLFESHYTEMAKGIDEIAERIRILGFSAPGSFSHFIAHTTISESTKPPKTAKMIAELLEGHYVVINEGRALTPISDRAGDIVTTDLMVKRLTQHEKASWQLRSLLEV